MRSFLQGFGYAFDGIGYVVRTQRNMRVHLLITVLVILAAVIFRVSAVEWAILILSIGVVLAAEMANTAMEAAVDLMTHTIDPRARVAKDASAAAVLVAALASVGVGLAIFGPRLLTYLF